MTRENATATADQVQIDIYRRMKPEERLAQAVRMNRTMRQLMDAGIRAEHPDWSDQQRQRELARRILTARTS